MGYLKTCSQVDIHFNGVLQDFFSLSSLFDNCDIPELLIEVLMYDSVYGSIQPPGDLLWEKLEEAEIDNIKEFSDLFSRQVVERKPTKKKEEKPSKVQAMKILDSKRSQSVGILASSLHVDFSEIENGKLFCVTVHYDVLKEYNIVFLIFQNRII